MESVRFANGIWAETVRVMQMSSKYVLLYVGAITLLAALPELLTRDGEWSSKWIAEAFAAAMLAIPAHLAVLRNSATFDRAASNAMTGFVFRGIGVALISLILPIVVMIFAMYLGADMVLAIIAMCFVWLFTASASFALWGTMLPATITDHARSFSRARQRGSLTFGYAFPRLLISFGLLTVLQLLAAIGIATLSQGDGKFFPEAGGVDIIMVVAVIVGACVSAFGLVMTAVILSRSFLISEGKTTLA